MLSETRERFARAIVAKVPAERIVEIHFFQPIRQGGVESGVAVVAANPERPVGPEGELLNMSGAVPAAEEETPAPIVEPPPAEESQPELSLEPPEVSGDECVVIPAHTIEPDEIGDRLPESSDEHEDDVVASDREVELPMGHAPFGAPDDISSDDENDEQAAARRKAREALAAIDALSAPAMTNAVTERQGPPQRLTVFTARYRFVLKGPDRGKWEATVVAEADAPLPTVDAVVRGVLRRAGDAQDAERMSGEELAAELGALGPKS